MSTSSQQQQGKSNMTPISVPHPFTVKMQSYSMRDSQEAGTSSSYAHGPNGTPKMSKKKKLKPQVEDVDDNPDAAFDESRWQVKGVAEFKTGSQGGRKVDVTMLSHLPATSMAVQLGTFSSKSNSSNNATNILAAPTDEASDSEDDNDRRYRHALAESLKMLDTESAHDQSSATLPSDFGGPLVVHDAQLATLSEIFPQKSLEELRVALNAADGDVSRVSALLVQDSDDDLQEMLIDSSQPVKRGRKSKVEARKKRKVQTSSTI